MKTYVIGDLHGELLKLKEALQLVNFDYENDRLISIGDIVDRGQYSYECVEELMKIKNLIAVRGNHDQSWLDYLQGVTAMPALYMQGAKETYISYMEAKKDPRIHLNFFLNQLPYFIDENKNLFIHGGFNRHEPLEGQSENVYYWDRDLFLAALSYKSMKRKTHQFKYKDRFSTIFVGHTPTIYWDETTPINAANIWNVDTGCGKGNHPLTIMDVETKEYWQTKIY